MGSSKGMISRTPCFSKGVHSGFVQFNTALPSWSTEDLGNSNHMERDFGTELEWVSRTSLVSKANRISNMDNLSQHIRGVRLVWSHKGLQRLLREVVVGSIDIERNVSSALCRE